VPESLELPSVDVVTVGTVGEPGHRTFYVQASSGATSLTLKVEKAQVAGLATAFKELLADLPPSAYVEPMPALREPIEPMWAVGGIGVSAYDEATARVTVLLQQLVGEDEEGAEVRIGLSIPQMAAFVERGEALVAGGRPPCPLCGNPMDPEGHACPKTNGHLKH